MKTTDWKVSLTVGGKLYGGICDTYMDAVRQAAYELPIRSNAAPGESITLEIVPVPHGEQQVCDDTPRRPRVRPFEPITFERDDRLIDPGFFREPSIAPRVDEPDA